MYDSHARRLRLEKLLHLEDGPQVMIRGGKRENGDVWCLWLPVFIKVVYKRPRAPCPGLFVGAVRAKYQN
jgi:hypothetical protein